MTMKHDNLKPMECSKNTAKREVYSNTILTQETNKQKTLTRQPNFTPRTTGKRRRKKTQKLVEGKKSQRSKQK